MAIDLRHIMTVLRIAGDLERIGDLAKNIAKRALAIAGESHPQAADDRPRHMVELRAASSSRKCSTPIAERDAAKALERLARTTAHRRACTTRCSASS